MNNIERDTELYASHCLNRMCISCQYCRNDLVDKYTDVPAVITCYHNYILSKYYIIDMNKLQYLDMDSIAELYIRIKEGLKRGPTTAAYIRRYMDCILSQDYLVIREK